MLKSTQSFSRVLIGLVLFCFITFVARDTALYAANSSLKQIRCHRYEEGGKPVKVRISLDFTGKPERLNLQRSDDPFGNVPSGYVEDFIIVTLDEAAADAIDQVNINYGTAKGTLNIRIEDHAIYLAVLKGYELQESSFNYLDADKVAYIDMKLAIRTEMPEPKVAEEPAAVPDTVFIEKVVHDTIYIEIGDTAQVVHDTIYIEKIIYVEKGEEFNKLNSIKCQHYVHWWDNPDFRLDLCFSMNTEKLVIEKSRERLDDIPDGYSVQYVIHPRDKGIPQLFDDTYVKYVRCSGKILLKQVQDNYYLLAEEGIVLKPDRFTYDEYNRKACLRLGYY